MRVLVISVIELNEMNASGGTFANWLTGWDDTVISSLYCRQAITHNDFCDSYYHLSSISILKNIFTPWKIGQFTNAVSAQNGHSNIENSLLRKTKRGRLAWLYVLDDIIINTRLWQNRKYKKYISEFNPDVVFCFASSVAFIYQNLKYVKQHTNAKIVLFYADDVYSQYQQLGLKNWIFRKRFPKVIKLSDKNYGASVLMCNTYSKLFGISMSPLYKGCLINPPKDSCNSPIKLVYAGNLYYGREKSLANVASALRNINNAKGRIAATLEIYTTALITDEIDAMLNIDGSSRIMGERPYSEIKEIQKNADVVLHVESFNPENIKQTRLSYSTKISDCLQSGSMTIVIGPDGIASVEEAKMIDGVRVINDENQIEASLKTIIDNPTIIVDAAHKTHNSVANDKFQLDSVRMRLHNEFENLIKEK